ncbi:DUF3892 domain-containing protein [Pseudoduganella sp. S-14]
MADYQITCINLSHNGGRHEHITHVGNPAAWGATKLTVADVIANINKGHTFFVRDPYGRRAEVGVVNANPPYIRTRADNVWTDNLLAQTSCPLY